jgi:hypothetical protein
VRGCLRVCFHWQSHPKHRSVGALALSAVHCARDSSACAVASYICCTITARYCWILWRASTTVVDLNAKSPLVTYSHAVSSFSNGTHTHLTSNNALHVAVPVSEVKTCW